MSLCAKPNMKNQPHIAIISENTLESYGLKSLMEGIIPFAEIDIFMSIDEAMSQHRKQRFFHFFVAASLWMVCSDKVKDLAKHIIIFGSQELRSGIDTEMHFIATNVSSEKLTRSLMILQHFAHHQFSRYPQEISSELKKEDARRTASLTAREIEVLKMVACGKSSKEIADEIHISLHTVNTHRKNIMDKLDAHSATKIVAYAVNHGYIDLSK